MDFAESIKSCFSNYATFSGRASRSEFWWFQLFQLILVAALALTGPGIFLALATLLPAWAVGVRRLHDIDKSGWNILWYVLPGIGLILLLIWNTRRGTEGENGYGQDPLADSAPIRSPSPSATVSDKAEQLAKLKVLLETNAITQVEFDKMKAELLAG
jgi:uncharacterized membrane protein YhaH (DUF805 family)